MWIIITPRPKISELPEDSSGHCAKIRKTKSP